MNKKDKDTTQAGAVSEKPEENGVETSGDSFGGDEPTAELLRKLEETQAKAQENHDKMMRAIADLENYRKRAAREKDEIRKYGASGLVEDLLPALDNLQLGLKSAEEHHPEAHAVIEGIEMVFGQLMNVLRQHGLEPVNPQGESFDPNLHEGVSHLPHAEVPEGHIAEVIRPGYTLNGRLLRPANVVVSSGPPPEASAEE